MEKSKSPAHSYLSELHLPLLYSLVVLSIILGSVGYAFRPGTDEPPAVPNTAFTLYVGQPGTTSQVMVDEIMMQQTPSIVLVQLDVFAAFTTSGPENWELATSRFQSQPDLCPDSRRIAYFGTAEPDPVNAAATPAQADGFFGTVSPNTASNVLGLQGQAPGPVQPGHVVPVAQVNLCWNSNRPIAFDGAFASASLPEVNDYAEDGTLLPLDLTRSLYFDNPRENLQPVTAEYTLQAGTPPTSIDPQGWHWAASVGRGTIQLTATNTQFSQHEAYLGFVSGVLFGIVGGALVLILQELLEPIRTERKPRNQNTSKRIRLGGAFIAMIVATAVIIFAATYSNGNSEPGGVTPGNVQQHSNVLVSVECSTQHDEGLYEPATIQLTCGDGTAVANGLTWSQWGPTTATGYGTVNEVDCTPDCANGKDNSYLVTIDLSRPVKAADGNEYFVLITLTFIGDHPVGSSTQTFTICPYNAEAPCPSST